MKKIIYTFILLLVMVCGLVFSFAPFTSCSRVNRENNNEITKKPTQKPLSVAESKAALKKWEDSPDGIMYNEWKASAAGKKVFASEDKIRNSIRDFSNMEGVVTSLSLPAGSRLGFGVKVKINGDDYILVFGPEKPNNNEFQQLHNMKVNDKIIIKSHNVSHAPKYSYPIVAGDFVEQNGKIIYKRVRSKDGC